MKTTFFLLLLCITVFAQMDLPLYMEILPQTVNFNESDSINFIIEPVYTAWYNDEYYNYYVYSNPVETNQKIQGNSYGYTDEFGFNVYPHNAGYPYFWISKNKMTIKYLNWDTENWDQIIFFYIDYRDCNYGKSGVNDITIRAKKDEDNIYLYYSPGLNMNGENDLTGFTLINQSDLLNIWEINSYGTHYITCILANPCSLSISNQNNHPYLTWSHNNISGGTYYYEVWRQLTQFTPPSGSWTLVSTVSNKYYTDYEVYVGDGSWGRAYYKIRAKIDDIYSAYSAYSYINYEGLQKDFYDTYADKINYNLFNNYPNPFNPITKIIYAIPEPTFVQLKVFDPFGKEVSLLVNERKEAGIYQTEFNAGNLSTGIYFYQLRTNNFISTKKMLVVK